MALRCFSWCDALTCYPLLCRLSHPSLQVRNVVQGLERCCTSQGLWSGSCALDLWGWSCWGWWCLVVRDPQWISLNRSCCCLQALACTQLRCRLLAFHHPWPVLRVCEVLVKVLEHCLQSSDGCLSLLATELTMNATAVVKVQGVALVLG